MEFNLNISLPLRDPVMIFALLLFIILITPIVLRRLRIPPIIGLILAGVAIGPYGFNLIVKDGGLDLLSTTGLLYIMFMAGLEMDMIEFLQNKFKGMAFGILTFIIPFGIGFPICLYLLKLNLLSSILISIMFSSHTLVTYPIASRMGVIRNPAVPITLAATIITDTLVLVILSVVSNYSDGMTDYSYWLNFTVLFTAFIVFIIFIFPLIGRWFFKNTDGEKNSQFVFILAMLFLASVLARIASMEPIVGAFLAGLALNRLVPHNSSLMNRIDFVGHALFIPIFLIAVGMIVDVKILFNGTYAFVFAGILTAITITGKFLAAHISRFIFGFSRKQGDLMFGLSVSHAAATLAVVMVGFRNGLLTEEMLNGAVIIILVTCILATIVTEKASREIAIEEREKNIVHIGQVERLLVPISNPASMEHMIDLSVMLKGSQNQDPIYALSVINDDPEIRLKVLQAREILERAISHHAGDQIIQAITRIDLNPANGIIRAAKEMATTDIIIGWHGPISTDELIFGSTLDALLNQTSQNIFVCRLTRPLNLIKRIVLLAPPNAELEYGFRSWADKIINLAQRTGAKILLLGNKETYNAIVHQRRINITIEAFSDWSNMEQLLPIIHENDLLILVNARKGTLSYISNMESIPRHIARTLPDPLFITIYPEQTSDDTRKTSLFGGELGHFTIGEQINKITNITVGAVKKIFPDKES